MRRGWIISVMVVGGCRPEPAEVPAPADTPVPVATARTGGAPEPQTNPSPRDAPPPPWTRPVLDDPGVPEIDRGVLLDAPTRFEHVTLRAGLPVGARYEDLVYEGNNKNFRAKPNAAGLYRGGDAAAEDWRRWIAGVKAMIVLRDSLFSQQDHPVLQAPRALMLPPSWVSVAVDEALAGRVVVPPSVPALDDDAGWAAAGSAAERFGSFPPSDRLFTESSRPLAGEEVSVGQHARTRNARASIAVLGLAADAMAAASAHDPRTVAEAGAEWIAVSDVNYFGAALRPVVIPIFVENPNEHEARDEGKGMGVWGRALAPEAVVLARDVVYARRLQDGPLGIERYDLRHEAEQTRAVALLETLVPRGSRGHPVWLWVNGGSDGHGNGEPALPYVPAFEAKLSEADIERTRVVLLSKPSVRPRGPKAASVLETFATQTRSLGIPASVQLNTRAARRLFR